MDRTVNSWKFFISFFGIIVLGLFTGYLLDVSRKFAPQERTAPAISPLFITTPPMEKVVFKTKDGFDITADYYAPSGASAKAVLLIHMMPADRTSWRAFAPKLHGKGYHVLAIDLRGHGESVLQTINDERRTIHYSNFSDEEHQASIHDLEAGAAFLEGKGAKKEELVLVGASIGANLALWYAAEHPEIKSVVLLSPGFNYRGIETVPLMRKLHVGQRALLAGSEDDFQSRRYVLQTLSAEAPEGAVTKVVLYRSLGHGTDMLTEPGLEEEIINWIQ